MPGNNKVLHHIHGFGVAGYDRSGGPLLTADLWPKNKWVKSQSTQGEVTIYEYGSVDQDWAG